jgi:hypothetical protein
MSEKKRKPIAPYMAVGLSTVVYGIVQRKHIKYNLKTVEENIHAAVSMVEYQYACQVIALAEGALTGLPMRPLICPTLLL